MNQIDINNNAIYVLIYNEDENGWGFLPPIRISRAYAFFDQQRRMLATKCLNYPESCTVTQLLSIRPSDFHDLGILLPRQGQTFNDFASFVVPLCLAAQ